jgi:hypothetical protein
MLGTALAASLLAGWGQRMAGGTMGNYETQNVHGIITDMCAPGIVLLSYTANMQLILSYVLTLHGAQHTPSGHQGCRCKNSHHITISTLWTLTTPDPWDATCECIVTYATPCDARGSFRQIALLSSPMASSGHQYCYKSIVASQNRIQQILADHEDY